MRVLAFDQATTTGWAFGEDAGRVVCGTFRLRPGPSEGERLLAFERHCVERIERFEPDLIVYEEPWFPWGRQQSNANPATIKWLLKIEATLITTAARMHLPADCVRPDDWRASFLGYARKPKGADEKHMKTAVYERCRVLRYPVENIDESDACGLLWHALHGSAAARRNQGDLLSSLGATL